MFCYVLDKSSSQFIETESLYPHDIALLIDNKTKVVYLWFGERSINEDRELGTRMAREIMDKYKSYSLTILGESTIPLKIQSEIDALLGDNAEAQKIPRTKSMNVFVILGYLGIIAMGIVLINNLRMLSWDSQDLVYSVNEDAFYDLFSISVITAIIAASIYFAQLIAGIVTKKIFLVICAIASLAMTIGTMLYLAEGEYIFEFATGLEDGGNYLIYREDIIIHLIWIFVMWLLSSVPVVVSAKIIQTQTIIVEATEEDMEKLRLSSKPTILREKKVAIAKLEESQ